MDNNISFGSATHVYFFTTKGQRIVSDKNMRKCERYLVRQLNNAKNLAVKNDELVKTFKYDARADVGDKDYFNIPIVRSVYEYEPDRTKAFVNIISGKDVGKVDEIAKEIGKAKHNALERIGITKSFETDYAVDRYNYKAPRFADTKGIYKDGERQAFGVIFEPVYKKNGDLKEFKYNRCGYFNESFMDKKQNPKLV